jgi:hypothetical protein
MMNACNGRRPLILEDRRRACSAHSIAGERAAQLPLGPCIGGARTEGIAEAFPSPEEMTGMQGEILETKHLLTACLP